MLELLQDRPLVPRRIVVGGEQQDRQAVDRRRGRAGDHIGRAGPDRCRARESRQPPVRLGEANRRVDHRLLVARLVIRQVPSAFLQCLPHAADVAVAEDAEHRRDQASGPAVPLAVLGLEVLHHRLRHGQADRSRGLGEVVMGDLISFRDSIWIEVRKHCCPRNVTYARALVSDLCPNHTARRSRLPPSSVVSREFS